MKDSICAYDILEKIKKIENDFVVNGDAVLTKNIKRDIDMIDWECLKEQNIIELNKKNIQDVSHRIFTDELIDERWSEPNIRLLNKNRNVTQCLPPNTRLKFIKIFINRIMTVSLRYQETFNNALVGLMSQIVTKINSLNKQFISFDKFACEIKSEVESIKTHIDYTNEQVKKNNDLLQNLNEKVNQQESWLKSISDGDEESADKITDDILQNLNEKVNQQESWLKSVSIRVEDNENWLKSLGYKNESNEKWIKLTNNRVDGQEKWLSTTNKRIDACNEMLSISPEIGYQSFSQAGEDTIVMHILSKMENEINRISYLDIGCNHYKNFNNTYRLYRKGYSGVLVEANPMLIDEIKKNRPRDIVLNNGIGIDSNKVMDFYVINGGGLSSFNKAVIDDVISNDSDAFVEKIEKIKVITFNEIVERYFSEVPTIVSIDIEGDEYFVLNSIDYNRFRPLVFIVETIEYRKNLTIGTKRNDIIEVMKSKGYLEFAFTGVNSIFIDSNKVSVEDIK